MRRKTSSNIPKARSLLETGLKLKDWRYVRMALALMTRAKAVRRARSKRKKITAKQIADTNRIAVTEPNTSLHEITIRTGLPNAGRASEIVSGLRK